MEILEELSKIGIVPVIALDKKEDAKPLAKALCEGGIACAEITFRTAAAVESIRIMVREFPQMLIGAGTILSVEQVLNAVKAGAKFIVTPGFNSEIVTYCIKEQIPVIPGCITPSEVEQAMKLGLSVIKFFPAEAAGGIHMIKAMSAPYPNIRFMPTGGIDEKNLLAYLSFSKVIACGGSWMVKKELLERGDFATITSLTEQAIKHMLDFRIDSFAGSSNVNYCERNAEECLIITTNYLDRAVYYLENREILFDYESAEYDQKNKRISICLKGKMRNYNIKLAEKRVGNE